ncbi:isoleucine--tRNA ligase [Ceratobasidium sp. 394]|nr:isoleucine--tRNA ligase [Ceratobasidium sp. 394]
MSFPPHDIGAQFNFPKEEEKLSEGRPEFSFYDGPPFATGLPHYGHLLAGTVKDIVTRHAHASGFHVERRFGWDTHGLPVEHEIDKKLGITGREEVMAMGIDKYNAECRAIVMRYAGKWRTTVERMGRWIDFDNDYKTFNLGFMESCWDASDAAVIVSFPLVDDPSTSLLTWTTPWTLLSNLGLCVHPEFTYVKIHDPRHKCNFILHENPLTTLYKDPKKADFKKVGQFRGADMKGWRYTPLFDYFTEQFEDRAFRVLNDTYVTSDSGTGIVHQAPAFGEDDHRIALAHGVIRNDEVPPCPLDDAGRFTKEVPDFEGQYVKTVDKGIQKALKSKGRLIAQSTVIHQSHTPLLYKAIPSWFIRVQPAVDQLVENNAETRWVPQSVGDNRFGNRIANARDWNLFRNRYWGTPIPLWVSEDFEELEELSGIKGINDIHRDKIDQITIPSKSGKGVLKCIDEVFDCWFESGRCVAVRHVCERKKYFNPTPACPMHKFTTLSRTRNDPRVVLQASRIVDAPIWVAPWKNLIVSGLVLAADGKRMSKSLKNYPDPNLIINQYGADATRMYLVNLSIVRAENLGFREEGVRDVISRVLLSWLNSYRFFLGQVALLKESGINFAYDAHKERSTNVMDRWILARCQSLIKLVREEMAAYRLYTIVPRLLDLVDELTNWYIRFNRKRLKGEDGPGVAVAALNTLFETLFTLCRTMSSYTSIIENIYQGLRPFIPKSPDVWRSCSWLLCSA